MFFTFLHFLHIHKLVFSAYTIFMIKDFLLGILSFTFFDFLVFAPVLLYFSAKKGAFVGIAFIFGLLTGIFLKLPFYLSLLFIPFALKEAGILKSRTSLKKNFIIRHAPPFAFGIIFSVFIRGGLIHTLGLSVPLFLAVCAMQNTAVNKYVSVWILVFYSIAFSVAGVI